MADELQTGIYGSNWWNSSRNLMGSPPCSGGFGWTTDMVDMNSRSNCDESSSAEDSCIVFQDIQKPQQHDCLSGGSGGGGGGGGGGVMMDSTMQMMGFNLSSSASSDWTQQTLLGANGKVESNYNSMLQDDLSSRLNYSQESEMEIQKDWSSKDFSGSVESMFKPIHQGFSLDQPTNFPMTSSAYTSTLLQSLFEPDPEPVMNYQSMGNYHTNSNQDQLLPWPKKSPYLKPKQLPGNHLQFSNNTPFWNASAVAQNDIRTGFISSSQVLAPTFEEKPNRASLTATPNMEEVREPRAGVKKTSSEPAFKRVRMETPSPLPTFKVRKEKLGDRITALQQLVSPFGKTDTASVLHEAIEYIKFLHDQVSVLSTPYMKSGLQHQLPSSDNLEESEEGKQDLRSRGLCLVPVSITYPVAHESTSDFWTPTFGGSYR